MKPPANPSTLTPIRALFRLRPWEWAPVLAAILINLGVGFFAASKMMGATDLGTSPPANLLHLLAAEHIVTPSLLLLGLGAWLWRLNRWIKERP